MAIPKKNKVNAAGVMAQLMAAQENPGVPGAPTLPGAEAAPEGLTAPPGAPSQSTPPPPPVAPPVSPVTKGMATRKPPAPVVKKRPEKDPGKRPVGRPTLPHDGELVKKGFYLPPDVAEALRVRQFQEPELTLSNHVVLALRQYLHMDEDEGN